MLVVLLFLTLLLSKMGPMKSEPLILLLVEDA